MLFDRITSDAAVMGGQPCIRSMRMPVATLLRMLSDGWSESQILADWPSLEQEDIRQALRYGAEATRVRLGMVP